MYTKSLTMFYNIKGDDWERFFSLQLQRAGGWCEPVRNNEPVAHEPFG